MRNFNIFVLLFFALSMNAQEAKDSLDIYIQDFQFKKALHLLDSLEDTKENKFQKAMCYKALGENRATISILEDLAEEYPDDRAIKIELAQSYERSSRWSNTIDAYNDLMAIDSTNLYFTIKKSEAEINQKDYKKAISNLQTVLEKDTVLSAVKLLGKSFETINNLDTAFYYYNMAWSYDPTDAYSATNMVNVALKKKEYLAALALSQEYLRMDTTDKQMNMLYGYTLYALEDYENAVTALDKCYQAGDSSLTVIRSLGMSYFYEGKSESAYEFLSKAYKQDTTNMVVLFNLATSATDIHKYEEAVDYHNKVLHKITPSNMQLYLNYRGLAIAYEKNEDYKKAAENYTNALKYAASNQKMDLLYPLAQIWDEKLDHLDMALMYYKRYEDDLKIYRDYMKEKDPNSEETKNLDAKLTELKEYIHTKSLDKMTAQEKREAEYRKDAEEKGSSNPTAPPTKDEILFVVNGEIVDTPPNDPNLKPISQKIIFDLDHVDNLQSDSIYIAKAKEEKKKMIIIARVESKEEVTN